MTTDMNPDEQVLETVSDVAFARLADVGGDPRKLSDPLRTVALVYAAQGVIDNGGLWYFFENDWPSHPPYAVFVDAYRTVNATSEADALAEALALFDFELPESDRVRRSAALQGQADYLESLDSRMTSDVWALLTAYARANEAAIVANRAEPTTD